KTEIACRLSPRIFPANLPTRMPDIVLTTLNAKYIHASFGLRYLLANLGDLQPRATILEFDLQQRPLETVETILQQSPKIVGLGIYIWNVRESFQVVRLLKQLRPDITVVLGGPEVSHETEQQPICQIADYIVQGEADLHFASLCQELLNHKPPSQKIQVAQLPSPADLSLPYHLYTPQDIQHRIVYVEASRGCPYTCEFCLSSLDSPVRAFPLNTLLHQLQHLFDQGLRHFKFVDRTFNLNLQTSQTLLNFFLDRLTPDLFLHFEMIPDRFPEALRSTVKQFPPGSLQFEIGIQTFNPEVAERIRRRQNYQRTEENLRFLRQETGAHLHTDLIFGLPGESLESFAQGFNHLLSFHPHEIQVGILKRLRGAPISRHDREWEMVYNPEPPYEILQNKLIDFPTLQRLRRFARAWDLVANSGSFTATVHFIWQRQPTSPFHAFLKWTDWLHQQNGQLHAIALNRLTTLLYTFLTTELNLPKDPVLSALAEDYSRTGRGDLPPSIRPTHSATTKEPSRRQRRQQRHQPSRRQTGRD
ncbi:MAG: DUF4080 domain-containing protein, partial [Limisphaerales bacterium]